MERREKEERRKESGILLNAVRAGVIGLATLWATGARGATFTIDWDAVTTNADASPIADLAGYRVFYATYSLLGMTTTQATAASSVTKVSVGNVLTRTVSGLQDGTSYYFRLTARDTSGNQSAFSELPDQVVMYGAGVALPQGFATPPGLKEAYCYPNPAEGVDPKIRAFMGGVDSVEVTIYDQAGQVAHAGRTTNTVTVNGETAHEYAWPGEKASGVYYAVIHGKKGNEMIRARAKFAVVR